jgi:hypothetical protein
MVMCWCGVRVGPILGYTINGLALAVPGGRGDILRER